MHESIALQAFPLRSLPEFTLLQLASAAPILCGPSVGTDPQKVITAARQLSASYVKVLCMALDSPHAVYDYCR